MAFFEHSLLQNFFLPIAGSLLVLYSLLAYLKNKWTRRGIPFANVHPIFGNIKKIIFRKETFVESIKGFYLEHKKKPFLAYFTLTQPTIMINDLELLKTILIKDFSCFTDRNFAAAESDPLQFHNVLSARSQTWKDLRQKLSPTFTSGKMKKMFGLIDACGKDLVLCLEKELVASGDTNVREFAGRFTTDVIATIAFGIDGNSLKDPESVFRQYMRKSLQVDTWQNFVSVLMLFFPSLVEKLGLRLTKHDVETYIRKTVWDTVEYREKNEVSRNDFLNLLMVLRKSGQLKEEEPLEEGEVVEKSNAILDLDGDKFVAQCFIFLLAGFETSSTTMSLALYELALNPDVQERLHEEITSVLGKYGGELTYDAIQDMKFLHMVILETLRKYPVLPFLDRRVTRPYRLPGTGIELVPGDSVMVPVIGLHHDPELYPEPERFDPERFSEEQSRARPPCSFLGFGDGPRICIGMRLGILQSKVGLLRMLLNYEVRPSSKTRIPLKYEKIALTDYAIELRLKKRTSS